MFGNTPHFRPGTGLRGTHAHAIPQRMVYQADHGAPGVEITCLGTLEYARGAPWSTWRTMRGGVAWARVPGRPAPGLKWGVLQNTQKADILHATSNATSTVAIRWAIVKRETKKVGCSGMKMKRYNHPNLGVRLVRRGIWAI